MDAEPWGLATLRAGVVLSAWEPALDRSWEPHTVEERARIRAGVAAVARHWERLGLAPVPGLRAAAAAADATQFHWLLRERLDAGRFAPEPPRAPPVAAGPPPAWAVAEAAEAAARMAAILRG